MLPDRITPYDKKKVFETYIRPVLKELEELCYEHDIPMFFTAAVANSNKGTDYESAMIMDDIKELKLKKNHIVDMVKIING